MLEFVASFVCHQLPERTLQIGGHLLPLCARCTGIYSGFLIGILFQMAVRKNLNRLPSLRITAVCILFILALVTEAVGEKMGLWELPGQARFLLGLLCGSALSTGSFPLLNYFLQKDDKDGSAIGPEDFVGLLAVLGLFFCLHYIRASLLIFSFISVAGILVCYIAANVTIAGMLLDWKKRVSSLQNTFAMIGLVLSLFLGEAAILNILG
jgi:uncharacterized membrane protein